MEDTTNFESVVASNPFVAERWTKICTQADADAQRLYGVSLTPKDVLRLQECRLAAMGTGKLDRDAYQAQLLAHPAFAEAQRVQRIRSGDLETTAAAVVEVMSIKSRCDRISAARRLSISEVGAAPDTSGLSKADTITLLLTLPPQSRLSMARKFGVI